MARRFTGFGLAINTTPATGSVATRPPVFLAPDATGTGAAGVVILVGDQHGRVMGELAGELLGVAWKLNDYGQARMVLPRTGATATERLLRPGNRVLIQFGNGLPDWGGMMDLPRKWKDGRIEVVAYSGERILTDRVTDRGRYFSNATAGAIFRALLNEAVPSGVDVGDVWMGGELHGPDYHFRNLYDIFTKSLSSRIESADWNVSARLAQGQIAFRANYYEKRGVDHGRQIALIEGLNLADASMQEQGPLVNEWLLAGAGTGWSADSRIYASGRDEASIAKYGLRQKGETRVDVSVQETLDRSAVVSLAGSKEPRAIVDPVALDLPPARWQQYDVGDTVWMELYDEGFDGYAAAVRIKAREFLPGRGVCSLVIE